MFSFLSLCQLFNTKFLTNFYQRKELEYDDDRSDNEDEKPTVVVLKEGDLTAEEAELAIKDEKTLSQEKGTYTCRL